MKAASLKGERNFYALLFDTSQLRDCNMDELFKHEHHNYPPFISEYGALRKTSKSDFLDCLQGCGSSMPTSPEFTAKVADGAATVQSLKPRISKTFGKYASTEFDKSVLRCLNEECVQRVDIVFHRYFSLSLKRDTRKGRGSGLRESVRENTPMVQDWAKFLKDSSNKAGFFHLIAEKITTNRTDHKMVLATQGENVIFLSIIDIDRSSSCNHEETDTRMFLHLKDFSAAGPRKASLETADTDVAVIAISLFHKLDLEELWIEFGTAVNLEWLPIDEYAENFGESICQAMPVWLVCTDCDTVSAFFERGKRLAWNTFKSYSAATGAFKM